MNNIYEIIEHFFHRVLKIVINEYMLIVLDYDEIINLKHIYTRLIVIPYE